MKDLYSSPAIVEVNKDIPMVITPSSLGETEVEERDNINCYYCDRNAKSNNDNHSKRILSEDDVKISSCSHHQNNTKAINKKRRRKRTYSLDNFEKHRIIGVGTFGNVWLVSKRNNKENNIRADEVDENDDVEKLSAYALKIYNKADLVIGGGVKTVLREKNIISDIHPPHPFIINLLSTFQDETSLYLLYKYYHGGELSHVISNNTNNNTLLPAKCKSTRFYTACILEAIHHLHGQRICHRDLKPQNILINEYGYCKLIDFGLAIRLEKDEDKAYTLCGTLEYLAPEILLSRGYNHTIDYWSIGILMYEMIYGQTPFAPPPRPTSSCEMMTDDGDNDVSDDNSSYYNSDDDECSEDDRQTTLFKNIIRFNYSFPGEENQDCAMPDDTSSSLSPSFGQEEVSLHLQAKDLIRKLLCQNDKRLQCTNDIRSHSFFQGINFTDLLQKKISPPWIPTIENPFDTKHFDTTKESNNQNKNNELLLTEKQQLMFKDF